MKRVCHIFCISLFVLAMATTAMATGTRVATMGDQDMFITDDANIWHWTSTVNNYPRHMIVDHDDAEWNDPYAGSGTRVGMIIPMMSSGVLGVFIGDGSTSWPLFPLSANNRVDLFYGNRMSNMDLGLHLEWWGDGAEKYGKDAVSIIGLSAGVAMQQGGNMMEINGFFRKISWDNEDVFGVGGAVTNTQDAGSHLGVAWRWMKSYNSMTTLIPAISVETWKVSETLLPAPNDADEYKGTLIDIGLGCNSVPLSGTEFLGSIGVMSSSSETSDSSGLTFDSKEMVTPYLKFGADIQVKPWLNFRVGASKYVLATTKTADLSVTPPVDLKTQSASFTYRLGVGIMVGDVQFDMELDDEWLEAGPYFLSGENDDDLFGRISFKYDFR